MSKPLKWGLIAIALGATAYGSFKLGQLTQPSPRLEIDTNETADMDRAWENFLAAQEKTRQYILAQPQYQDSPQSAAEGYRSILFNLTGAIELSLHDPNFPRFSRMPDLGSKSGMDNPDNIYKMAIIDGTQTYRISGKISSDRRLYLQSVYGQPGVGNAGYGTFAGTVTWENIKFGQNGEFEVIASPNAPENNQVWLKTDGGVETILLRLSDKKWDAKTAADHVSIERICEDCAAYPPPLSPKAMAKALNRTSQSLHDRTTSWTGIANRIWSLMPANEIGKPRVTPNGLTDQYSAFGKFDLLPDEALILTVPASNADYQGIQLGNLWFHSLEYKHRITSLTRNQSYIDPDGNITFVISSQDPKIQNWLDTGGSNQGLIMLRWQGINNAPSSEIKAAKVKYSTLNGHFTPNILNFSAIKRKEQIAKRAQTIKNRGQ